MLAAILVVPTATLWRVHAGNPEPATSATETRMFAAAPAAEDCALRYPVEVVRKGSAPEWVYVKVENQVVPEPGFLPLILLSALALLRRRRG